MAERQRFVRPTKKVVEAVEEDVVEEDVDVVEEDVDEDGTGNDEEVEIEPLPKAKSKLVLKGKSTPPPSPKTIVPTSKKIVPPPAKKATAPAAEEEAEEVEPVKPALSIKKISTEQFDSLIGNVVTALENGQTLIITAADDGKFHLALSANGPATVAPQAKPKLKGKAYDLEVLTPEYLAWEEEWHAMTPEEHKKKAKAVGAKWEKHADERLDTIRMTMAVREAMGIEKYKEQYRTQAARAKVAG